MVSMRGSMRGVDDEHSMVQNVEKARREPGEWCPEETISPSGGLSSVVD